MAMNIVERGPIHTELVFRRPYYDGEFKPSDELKQRVRNMIRIFGCTHFVRKAKRIRPEWTHDQDLFLPTETVSSNQVSLDIIRCFSGWETWSYCMIKVYRNKILVEFIWEKEDQPQRKIIGKLLPYQAFAA